MAPAGASVADTKISTIAGTGVAGYSGEGGPATAAAVNRPFGVAVDGAGNTYVADGSNNRVRRIATDGTMTTVAGTGAFGFSGDGGPATSANLRTPYGVAADALGNILITDSTGNRVRRVESNGIISTVAGTGGGAFSGDGGPATAATLRNPKGVTIDPAGGFYVADTDNNRIRHVDSSGKITTVAGTGTNPAFGGDGGSATAAALARPTSVAVSPAGGYFILDAFNNRVRRVDAGGKISTFAGGGTLTGDGIAATSAQLALSGLLVAGVPNVPAVGVAPNGDVVFTDPGSAGQPGLEVGQNLVMRVEPDGRLYTLAGTTGPAGYGGDGGPALSARLNGPTGLAIATTGRVIVADALNNRVRAIDAPPVSINDTAVKEGNSGTTPATLTVTVAPHQAPLVVNYATVDGSAMAGDNDYVPTSGTLTFAPGEYRKMITAQVVGDTFPELDETFTVRLTSLGLPTVSGVVTILNDDGPVPTLSAADAPYPPGTIEGTNATFTVSKVGATPKTVTVDYGTTDLTSDLTDPTAAHAPGDYTPTSGRLTFLPDETTKTVTVPTFNDAKPDRFARDFSLVLSNPTNAKIDRATAQASIIEDQGIVVGDTQVSGGTYANRNAVFPVTLAHASTDTVTVDYTTVDGTAAAPADYTAWSGTLAFGPGETSKTVLVPVKGSAGVPRPDRMFTVTLSHPLHLPIGRATATATIVGSPAPQWRPTAPATACLPIDSGSLQSPDCVARQSYTVTLLDGAPCHQPTPPVYCGKLLVAGGFVTTGTAQLYDPATGGWTPTGRMTTARYGHTATELPDGRVLVVGGTTSTDATSVIGSEEIYDPATGTWSPAGKRLPRNAHSATTLPDGRVLIAGGITAIPVGAPKDKKLLAVATATTDLFDPTARDPQTGAVGTWRSCSDSDASPDCPGPMATPRGTHSASLLPSGEVVVASGGGNADPPGSDLVPLTSSEVYNPATGRWRPTGQVAVSKSGGHAVLMGTAPCGGNCGKVLFLGGPLTVDAPASAEVYDPDAIAKDGVKGVWSPAPVPPLSDGMVVGLPSGRVLLASRALAGAYQPTAAVFDPASDSWESVPPITVPRDDYTLATLDGPLCRKADPPGYCGTVLAGSGRDQRGLPTDNEVPDVEVYAPQPTVGDVSPSTGPSRGGTTVVIHGSGFAGLGDVTVGGVAATNVTVDSDHQITAVLPPHPSGSSDIVVTSVGGTSGAVPDDTFGYAVSQAPARVADLSATVKSDHDVELTWSAPASDGPFPPPAGDYWVKVSKSPITDYASFSAAPALCAGDCPFSPKAVGDPLTLEVSSLTPGTTYHFAMFAVNEASLPGPLSGDVAATTTGKAPVSPAPTVAPTATPVTTAAPTTTVAATPPTTVAAELAPAAPPAGAAPAPSPPVSTPSTVAPARPAAPVTTVTTSAPTTTTAPRAPTTTAAPASGLALNAASPATSTKEAVPMVLWLIFGLSMLANFGAVGAVLSRRLRPPLARGR